MYFKASISTSLFFSVLLIFSLACNNRTHEGEVAERKPAKEKSAVDKKETGKEQIRKFSLTNENARSFLKKYGREHPENKVRVITPMGNIDIRLYENTPLHRANFLYMTERGYFDDTWFYRISEGHVIQAGLNDERETVEKRKSIGDFTVPSEIEAGNIHKRGAVAAARTYDNNPGKRSNPYEFYIMLGQVYTRPELERMEEKYNIHLDERQVNAYTTAGGGPHLDKEHTVFGEVVKGMDVVEKINSVEVDEGEWPLKNIPIRVEIIE